MNTSSLFSPHVILHLVTNPTTVEQAVSGVTSDSRKVGEGSVFVALTGTHTDGHKFLQQAADAGAVALVVDEARLAKLSLPEGIAIYSSPNTYQALGLLASRFYGEPGKKMTLVGVTGTNGKTTVTHLVEQMLKDAGQAVGLMGTLGTRVGLPKGISEETSDEVDVKAAGYTSTSHTTPMAVELQGILADMANEKLDTVVMEVSSHALEQHRVYGCDFKVAVHTNLTQDHLDFHRTMEEYCAAKCLLFSGLNPANNPVAVINADDAWASHFINSVPQGVQTLTYGMNEPNASVRATHVLYSIEGASFTVVTPSGEAKANLRIAGKFSVYNALGAIAAGLALGLSLPQIIASLEKVQGVRGRFEVVSQNPYVIVDYAHTPDGLENILAAARLVTPPDGQLITVFGCGGDRDATKRPKMGAIAERLADKLVITSDNPRSEDPQQILTDIINGIQRFDSSRMLVNVDRKAAIHQAIDMAEPNDIIVVAGKGHEDYQILADRTIHFDDREVVQTYVAAKQNNNHEPTVNAR